MLWSQELPAYSYTHRLGSLSQGMPYCPFCQNSVPSTRAAPGHAIARKPLPGISKTWPLFEHVNSFQLDKKLTLDWTLEVTRPLHAIAKIPPTPTTPKKNACLLDESFCTVIISKPTPRSRHPHKALPPKPPENRISTAECTDSTIYIWIPVP